MIGISECLIGNKCRYNKIGCPNKSIIDMLSKIKAKDYILLCPEKLGNLPTPRPPAEIIGGNGIDVLNKNAKVINNCGDDVTKQFLKGSYASLDLCLKNNVKTVYLKENSPSCGVNKIYDGSFSATKINGMGVFTALLSLNNINVISIK